MGSGHDRDWVLLPAFTFDLRRSGAVVPYLSAASGWLWHTDRFNGDSYTAQGWTIGGGGGVRVALGPCRKPHDANSRLKLRTPGVCLPID